MKLSILIAALSLASGALAQLTPDRTYYGVGRAVPMTIAVPAGAAGDVKVALLSPADAAVVQSAPAAAGAIDLQSVFPSIWSTPRLVYAQLIVGDTKVGPAVVLQPLLNPPYARLKTATGQVTIDPRAGQIRWDEGGTAFSGFRAWTDKHIVFDTSMGEVEFRLRPDVAPNSCWNFLRLAEGGFYTDIQFHRIVAQHPSNQPFVIQVGDPTGTGEGGPGYAIDLERSNLPHDFGVLSMARSGEPNSNGSQIFVCMSREATKHLDGNYTSFGQAVRGAETLMAIIAVPTDANGRPEIPPVLRSARLVDAPPFGTGPAPATKPAAPEPGR